MFNWLRPPLSLHYYFLVYFICFIYFIFCRDYYFHLYVFWMIAMPAVPPKRKRSFDHGRYHTGTADASNKRKQLRIEIPAFPLKVDTPDEESAEEDALAGLSAISGLSYDSLFDDETECTTTTTATSPITSIGERRKVAGKPALLDAPDIPGLFFTPSLKLPQELADSVTSFCMNQYFHTEGVNQVMLFGRFSSSDSHTSSTSGLPPVLLSLLVHLETVLRLTLPDKTYNLLFPEIPTQSRQAIINLYQPGEGITPHVDLLGRYADGIIGVSFGSGCVMRFDCVDESTGVEEWDRERKDLYLPERSVIVLSEDARYKWTHGIDKCVEDYVSVSDSNGNPESDDVLPHGRWLGRGVRLSVTFRWLLPGADVVGGS